MSTPSRAGLGGQGSAGAAMVIPEFDIGSYQSLLTNPVPKASQTSQSTPKAKAKVTSHTSSRTLAHIRMVPNFVLK